MSIPDDLLNNFFKHSREYQEQVQQHAYDEFVRLEAELGKHRWIPVSERPPTEESQIWILYEKTNYTYQGYYNIIYKTWHIFNYNGGFVQVSNNDKPTHWKPIILPESEANGTA